MKVNISNHAYDRGKERLGLSKKSIDRMAEKVLEKGIHGTDLKGSIYSWIQNKLDNHERTGDIYVYGDKAWVYSRKPNCILLITVLNIPANMQKKIAAQIA